MEFTELIHAKINWVLVGPNISDVFFKNKSEWSAMSDNFLLCLVTYATYFVCSFIVH